MSASSCRSRGWNLFRDLQSLPLLLMCQNQQNKKGREKNGKSIAHVLPRLWLKKSCEWFWPLHFMLTNRKQRKQVWHRRTKNCRTSSREHGDWTSGHKLEKKIYPHPNSFGPISVVISGLSKDTRWPTFFRFCLGLVIRVPFLLVKGFNDNIGFEFLLLVDLVNQCRDVQVCAGHLARVSDF